MRGPSSVYLCVGFFIPESVSYFRGQFTLGVRLRRHSLQRPSNVGCSRKNNVTGNVLAKENGQRFKRSFAPPRLCAHFTSSPSTCILVHSRLDAVSQISRFPASCFSYSRRGESMPRCLRRRPEPGEAGGTHALVRVYSRAAGGVAGLLQSVQKRPEPGREGR